MDDLLTVELLLNNLISTLGAKFMALDIKTFYLNTPVDLYKYIRLRFDIFPENPIKEYGLNKKSTKDGWISVNIRKGMYCSSNDQNTYMYRVNSPQFYGNMNGGRYVSPW